MKLGHLVLLLEPLPSHLGIEIGKIQLSHIVKDTALHGVFLCFPPFFPRIPDTADMVHIVKIGGLLLHDNSAKHGGCLPHQIRMHVNIRCEASDQCLKKVPVGDTVPGFHKGVGQLSQIEEETLSSGRFGKCLHIAQDSPVQIFKILCPHGEFFRMLLQILTVKGGN